MEKVWLFFIVLLWILFYFNFKFVLSFFVSLLKTLIKKVFSGYLDRINLIEIIFFVVLIVGIYAIWYFIWCLTFCDFINFLKLLIFLTVFYVFFWIFKYIKKYKHKSHYYEDKVDPQKSFDIWWKNSEDEIKRILKEDKFDELFKIAIIWHWGEGKTTFLEKSLKDKEIQDKSIVVKFPTWQFADDKDVLQSFMDEIYKSLFKHWYLFLELKFSSKYINKLVKDSVKVWWLKSLISFILELLTFFKEDSLEKLLKDIQYITWKRFVFIFDDLDRLKLDNLYTIFRLQDHLKKLENAISILIFERRSKVFEDLEKVYGKNFNEKIVNLFVYLHPSKNIVDVKRECKDEYSQWWWKNLRYAEKILKIFNDNGFNWKNKASKLDCNQGDLQSFLYSRNVIHSYLKPIIWTNIRKFKQFLNFLEYELKLYKDFRFLLCEKQLFIKLLIDFYWIEFRYFLEELSRRGLLTFSNVRNICRKISNIIWLYENIMWDVGNIQEQINNPLEESAELFLFFLKDVLWFEEKEIYEMINDIYKTEYFLNF